MEKIVEKFISWVGSISSLVVHTLLFVLAFASGFFGIPWDLVLLVLTTIVSLEAIYLAIFIQMSVNRNSQVISEVEKDIDEIQEDIEEIAEDVEEIAEDVEELEDDHRDKN